MELILKRNYVFNLMHKHDVGFSRRKLIPLCCWPFSGLCMHTIERKNLLIVASLSAGMPVALSVVWFSNNATFLRNNRAMCWSVAIICFDCVPLKLKNIRSLIECTFDFKVFFVANGLWSISVSIKKKRIFFLNYPFCIIKIRN